jgi:hypothetical protein
LLYSLETRASIGGSHYQSREAKSFFYSVSIPFSSYFSFFS